MRKFLLGTALAAVLILPAQAADLRPAPAPVYTKAPLIPTVYNWSGFWGEAHFSYAVNFTNMLTDIGQGATVLDLASTPKGPGVGGGLDALYQPAGSPWLIGLSAELGWLDMKAGSAVTAGSSTNILSVNNATNWLGNIDGVVGHAFGNDGRFLIYGFAGFAFGGASPDVTATGLCIASPTTSCGQAISETSVGWNAGAGAKYAVTDNVALFIKGNYTDLGSKQLSIPSGTPGAPPLLTSNAQFKILEQQAGIAIKFMGPN